MSFAVLEGGKFYHHEAIHGARLRDHFPQTIYAPAMTAADIKGHKALLVADRIDPSVLRRKRPLLLDFLANGGALFVLGENYAHEWAPDVSWHFRPTNFWWWLEKGADSGHRIMQPDHPLFRHMSPRDTIWHFHGLLDLPAGAVSLVDIAAEADPKKRGGSILYDHAVGGGRMIVTTLDPMYHHGSFFMPAASRFLTGVLAWMQVEFA